MTTQYLLVQAILIGATVFYSAIYTLRYLAPRLASRCWQWLWGSYPDPNRGQDTPRCSVGCASCSGCSLSVLFPKKTNKSKML